MNNGEVDRNKSSVSQPLLLSDDELKKFKQDYKSNGRYELNAQVAHLELLATRYLEAYRSTKHWKYAVKSHSTYNSVGYRRPYEEKWTRKAFYVMQQYLGDDMLLDFEAVQEINSELAKDLLELRNHLKSELEHVDCLASNFQASGDEKNSKELVANFCKQMQRNSILCTKKMSEVSRRVFNFSVSSLVQKPPCSFSVIALGSIAKGEATPYSDLEYIFLIEEKNEMTLEYFEKLAVMSYFIIGNLRETRLTNMAIAELCGWFDDQQMCGFRIDCLSARGGYIPTGSGEQTKNRFILTPNELFNQYRTVLENPVEEEAKSGDLTSVLQYTSLLFQHGKADLLEKFVSEKNKLNQNLSEEREKANILMFQEDAKKYNFRPETHLIEHAYTVNSKKDLYRFPSILLFNISILTGTCHSNSWETLQSLVRNQKISVTFHQSLTFLLACSSYVRLSSYLFHNSQDDKVSVLPHSTEICSMIVPLANAGRRWYLPMPLFLEMCLHVIPLKEHISACHSTDILELISRNIEAPSCLMKFQALHSCHRWLEAWRLFEQHFSIESFLHSKQVKNGISSLMSEAHHSLLQMWFSINALGYTLRQKRLYNQALNLHSAFLELVEQSDLVEQAKAEGIIAALYNEVGIIHTCLELHSEASTKHKEALDMRRSSGDIKVELLAKGYYLLGKCLRRMKDYDQAEPLLIEALNLYHTQAAREVTYDYYGYPIPQSDEPFSSLRHVKSADDRLLHLNYSCTVVAEILWNLGGIYFAQKWYQRALNYYIKAAEMEKDVYGSTASHKELSAAYSHISYCYVKLGNRTAADKYYRQSLMMIVQLFDGAGPLMEKLRIAERCSHDSELSLQNYYEVTDKVFHALPGYKERHPETAYLGLYGGMFAGFMHQYNLGYRVLQRAVEMFELSNCSGIYSQDIAKCKSAQREILWREEKTDEAINKFEESLGILEGVSGQVAKLEAAETRQNLGLLYAEQEDYDCALTHLSASQELYLKHCRSSTHPKLAEIHSQTEQTRRCI